MLSRWIAAAIIGFWLVMTGLLVRLEVWPERSQLLEVPVAHVFRVMFAHGQVSDLNIIGNGASLGHLVLQPKRDEPSGERRVDFNGGFLLRNAPGQNQRVLWNGSVRFAAAFRVSRVELNFAPRGSTETTSIQIVPQERRASYQVRNAEKVLHSSSFTLDENGVRQILREADIDETVLSAVKGNQFGKPAVTARQATLKIRNEEIEGYLLTVRIGETVFAEMWLSQLGQVLLVKTPFGYSLNAEDITL